MSSILGLSSTDGNTAHQKKKSESGTLAHSFEAAHQKRTWGASSFSSSSSAWTKRMPCSAAPPSPSCRRGAAPTTGPSSRAPGPPSLGPPSSSSPSPPSLSSCPQHVGRGRRALCRQRRRHQRAPAQQGEELPLRSAARCGLSSAAPGQRDSWAAPSEVVSSVPEGRRARRAPPPPRPWQASDLLRCGATSLPGSLRRSSTSKP